MDGKPIYKRYETARDARGITNYKVSKDTGIAQETLSSWRRDKYSPKRDKIRILAEYFNVSEQYFYDDSEPIFDVAAGQGRINDGYGEIEHGNKVDSEYTRIRIVGDSMYPTLMQNDIVRVHLVTDDITPNDLAIVKINGEEATCKHVEFTDTGIWLRAENKDVFEDKFYTIKEVMTLPVTIIGVADAIIERKL